MIIVTGATGFIGRNLIKKLVTKYSRKEIVVLVKNDAPQKEREGFNLINKLKLKHILLDLKTGAGLPEFETQPELVIHMAANTHTDEPDQDVNFLGTINLIKSLKKIGPKTHFIYFGTTAIMAGRKNCTKAFDENAKPSPTNEYGRTKLRSEEYVKKMVKRLHFRLTIVRLPTVYGKGARKDSFFDFITKNIKKNSIFTRLNWPGKTSLVYVEDVVNATLLITKKQPKPGSLQTLILSSDSPMMSEILSLSYKTLGVLYKPVNLPKYFWTIASYMRFPIFRLEKFIPSNIYNLLWRATLVTTNVIYCESSKTPKVLRGWKPLKLDERINSFIN